MDLLANYDDAENSESSPVPENQVQICDPISPSKMGNIINTSLQDEWDSFSKLISGVNTNESSDNPHTNTTEQNSHYLVDNVVTYPAEVFEQKSTEDLPLTRIPVPVPYPVETISFYPPPLPVQPVAYPDATFLGYCNKDPANVKATDFDRSVSRHEIMSLDTKKLERSTSSSSNSFSDYNVHSMSEDSQSLDGPPALTVQPDSYTREESDSEPPKLVRETSKSPSRVGSDLSKLPNTSGETSKSPSPFRSICYVKPKSPMNKLPTTSRETSKSPSFRSIDDVKPRSPLNKFPSTSGETSKSPSPFRSIGDVKLKSPMNELQSTSKETSKSPSPFRSSSDVTPKSRKLRSTSRDGSINRSRSHSRESSADKTRSPSRSKSRSLSRESSKSRIEDIPRSLFRELSKSKSKSRSRSRSVSSTKCVSKNKTRTKSRSRSRHRSRSKSRHGSKSKSRRNSRSRSRRRHTESKSKRRRSGSRSRRHSRSRSKHRSGNKYKRSKNRSRSLSRHRSRSKSRDGSRSKSKGKHHSKCHRSRSRSRSPHKTRDRYRHGSKDRKKRSYSRSRKRYHKSRSHSRDRRSRSLSRSRSRSRSKRKNFREVMRQQLLSTGKLLSENEAAGFVSEASKDKSGLPLVAKKIFAELSSGSSTVTPQVALLQTMAAMHQKAQEITGVAVPKFYNPAAVNPLKYAEQVQKRKLLWSKSKVVHDDKETQWQSATNFTSDKDGKVTAKFRRLMGMKDSEMGQQEQTDEQKLRQDELFSRLDKEYEFARMTTHTQRGVGLGFSSQIYNPNPANPGS